MELLDNLSQLSKRGLLELPRPPDAKYQIVQYPDGFINVEDTERVFRVPGKTVGYNVSINSNYSCVTRLM